MRYLIGYNHSCQLVDGTIADKAVPTKMASSNGVFRIGAGINHSIVIDGEIEVNESLLTGEADNILKKEEDLLLSRKLCS